MYQLLPNSKLSHYRIISKIGEGGMGEVYLAEDSRLRRKVAIKILPETSAADENRRRFEQEAFAASALNHPNILTIHEVGEDGGSHFIVSEYINGQSLRSRIAELSLMESLEISIQIATALEAAHKSGIVHRDIKPENVMVREDGVVKVLDFGLAKITRSTPPNADTEDETRAHVHTKTGTIMGTASYMSPEQARGKDIDEKTDIWSLGVVIYEMLTLKKPFGGETQFDVIASILRSDPLPVESANELIPADLAHIVRKTLRKDKEARYQSMRGLLADLRDVREGISYSEKLERSSELKQAASEQPTAQFERAAVPDSARFLPGDRRQRQFALGLLAAVFILSTLAASYWYWFMSTTQIRFANASGSIRSLAILPFKSLDKEDDDHLGIGIADTVIGKVSQINGMIVRPTSAVQKYTGADVNSLEAAKQLGVDAVLDGTVHRAGDRLRVGANLLRTSDGASLWAESFDMRFTDIFTIEDEVAKQVAARLRLKLNPAETARLAKRSTTNAEAFEHYARGVQIFHGGRVGRYGSEKIRAAAQEFKLAVATDPNYGQAHAQLAYMYALISVYYETENPNYLGLARQEMRAADTLDSELAETHLARYEIYYSVFENFQIDEAVRELRLAQQLDPNAGHIQMAHLYGHLGLETPALRELQRAMEIDPASDVNRGRYINVHEMLGKSDEAIAAGIRFFPNQPERHAFYSYLRSNHLDEAQKLIDAGLANAPNDQNLNSSRVLLLAVRGKLREAGAEIPKIAAAAKPGRAFHHVAHDIAAVYALQGRAPESVEWLKKAADTGLPNYPMFARDPNFVRIRDDKIFVRFMTELQIRWEKYHNELQ